MATQKKPILTITRNATAAIAAYQAVTLLGAVAAAGADAAGFAISDAAIGQDFGVDVLGTSTGLAGEALDEGVAVEVGADGTLVEQSEGARIGWTLFSAGAGQPVEVLIEKAPAPPGGGG